VITSLRFVKQIEKMVKNKKKKKKKENKKKKKLFVLLQKEGKEARKELSKRNYLTFKLRMRYFDFTDIKFLRMKYLLVPRE